MTPNLASFDARFKAQSKLNLWQELYHEKIKNASEDCNTQSS